MMILKYTWQFAPPKPETASPAMTWFVVLAEATMMCPAKQTYMLSKESK